MFSPGGKVVLYENVELKLEKCGPAEVQLSIDSGNKGQSWPIYFKKDHINRGWLQSAISSRTWSNQAINQARAWISACRQSHNKCKERSGLGRLPLRFIDITPETDHGEVTQQCYTHDSQQLSAHLDSCVRICCSEGLPLDTPYLTLSYRWHEDPILLLKDETITTFRDRIPAEILQVPEAATVRDAIHVTRSLGLRYLWVDALCIKQDDEAEKATEISHMGQIYSGSVLNISAAAGTNGLFFERDPLFVTPCVRYMSKRRGPKGNTNEIQIEIAAYYSDYTTSIYWECSKVCASEVLPQKMEDVLPHKMDYLGVRRSLSYGLDSYPPVLLGNLWYGMVCRYSRTSLTFPSDRLRAFSAISREFCSLLKLAPEAFCAGMWKPDLPESLLWYEPYEACEDSPVKFENGETKYLAPSWSWASVEHPISFQDLPSGTPDDSKIAVSVVKFQMTPRSQDPFDSPLDGYLRVRGPIYKVRHRGHNVSSWSQRSVLTVGHRDSGEGPADMLREWNSSRVYIRWDRFRIDLSALNNDLSDSLRFVYLLCIFYKTESDYGQINGVVLWRIEGRGCYVRRGIFAAYVPRFERSSKLVDIFGGPSYALGEDEYLDVDGDENYTIDIL
ncbi:heterokaryon incompatibility protein-domain-containing protein [Hypoxylon sp. NC0597]|nr:heterokaryon incompatibility protein-domain-containing protein [Hypoxylon sp. NC0597]